MNGVEDGKGVVPDGAIGLPRVHVLMTVHDRKGETLSCLSRLAAESENLGARVKVILVDDGSKDGTAAAVRHQFPEVQLVEGSGHLYWNGGMRRAFEVAMREDPEFYLLLNDDTHLLPGALRTLLTTHAEQTGKDGRPCIVVGSTIDPVTGKHSYGGWRRGGWLNPVRLERIPPGPQPKPCDTLHGNCVLVPREVVRRIGNLDPAFTHSMGDIDYGFRAVRAGCALWIAPGYVAECVENAGKGLFVEASLGVREQWRRIIGPKGLPPSAWLLFTSRHCGPLWPLVFCSPYVKLWWNALRRTLAPAQRKTP